VATLARHISRAGFIRNFVVWREDGDEEAGRFTIGGGNVRYTACRDVLHVPSDREVWVALCFPESEAEKIEISLLDNVRSGRYVDQDLAELVAPYAAEIELSDYGVDIADPVRLSDIMQFFGPGGADPSAMEVEPINLSEKFIMPPFSVLDARRGFWLERKRRWMALGIRSELGRGGNLLNFSDTVRSVMAKKGAMFEGNQALLYRENIRGNKEPLFIRSSRTVLASQGRKMKGILGTSPSGMVPNYYAQKRAKEKELGRRLSPAEFETKYLRLPENVSSLSGSGTSVFDPVLCELVYRWFAPSSGSVLDPFAGGSVRGLIAAFLGYRYTGIELRAEQVEANRVQASTVLSRHEAPHEAGVEGGDLEPTLTPIERVGEMWLKREDSFRYAGVCGGKTRAALALIRSREAEARRGIVTAGSRSSPQVATVAAIGHRLGFPVRAHVPSGRLSLDLERAREEGAEIVQHRAGRNTLIKARAREDALKHQLLEIPFGMECEEAVELTAAQTTNLPSEAKRLVVPIGSGLSLAGVLRGLERDKNEISVVGVRVGADPQRILDRWAPKGWRKRVRIISAGVPYDEHVEAEIGGIRLDPVYEAKCMRFLRPGDCLWIVGIRRSALEAPRALRFHPEPRWIVGDAYDAPALVSGPFDLLFSCPPYFNLEHYSDLPGELSAIASYEAFLVRYAEIIARAASLLSPDRFAVFVVSDVRDRASGFYHNLVADTISAFERAGLRLYNHAILVQPVGSLPIRVIKWFENSRKLGKTHQNVLIFFKGDPVKIRKIYGSVEITLPDEEPVDLEKALGESVESEPLPEALDE
jgi:1-aminocyclopropane-1-carboxylate deaminase/D-cysteine desulfhydrase-like pyridoxal-dependent ACC family enzyme